MRITASSTSVHNKHSNPALIDAENRRSDSCSIKDDRFCGRLFKIFVFLGCLAGFFYQTYSFVQLFSQYPTVVQVDVEFADLLKFPAVTVCHNNRLRRSSLCSENPVFCAANLYCDGLLKDTVIQEFVSTLPPENVTQFSPRDFIGCRTETASNDTLFDFCSDIVRLISSDFPTCFSYNNRVEYKDGAPAVARVGDAVSLELDMEARQATEDERDVGAKLIIHDPYDAVYPTLEGFHIQPGFHYDLTLKQTTKYTLPPPYHTNCTNYTEYRHFPLVGQGPVSRRLCVHECLLNRSITFCGCVATWMHVRKPLKSIFCKREQQDSCIKPEMIPIRRFCEDICKQSCETVIYDVNLQRRRYPTKMIYIQNETFWDEWRMNNAVVKIFFTTREHAIYTYKPKYEGVELFSFIGGYVGIWLGISLVSLIDFLRNSFLVARDVTQRKENEQK